MKDVRDPKDLTIHDGKNISDGKTTMDIVVFLCL